MSPAASSAPQLAPPGTGLPPIELVVARRLFALRCLLTTRGGALRAVEEERAAIASLVNTRSGRDLSERVLIPRLRGLEDSSRYWSAYMVLEHLRIVNKAIGSVIRSLIAGKVPPHVASTAAVKPSPGAGVEAITGFEESCVPLLEVGRSAESLQTKLRFAHPWFGPLDAAQWQVLSSGHMALHRKQLAVIFSTQRSLQNGKQ